MTRIWSLVFLALALVAPSAFAQSATPALSAVAGGLINPYGFAFGAGGQLIVAETGTGGDQPAPEDVPAPAGPYLGGLTGRISRIDAGCPVPLAADLGSARAESGQTLGPSAVAVIGDTIYALLAGGGAAHANPDQPAGVYDVTSGSPALIADLGAWLRANPVVAPPAEGFDPDGQWVAMAAAPDGASLVVVESNSEQVVRVGLDGTIARMADLSAGDSAPSSVAVAPDGATYVGNMSQPPYATGSASVIRIGSDGAAETIWSGLTLVSGIAIDGRGTLYAAEFSAGRDRPPVIQPGTGRIIRQTGVDTVEEVATQLNLPTAIAFGPDGALFVSLPLVGADAGTGVILRVDTSAELPLVAENFDLTPPSCGAPSDTVLIKVSDLGLDPASVTITAGKTVTWRNTGEFDHAVVSDPASPVQWDSGPLRPGEEFSQTFDQPGTYAYADGVFPDHTGTIEVVSGG
jgi:plastocyanin